MRVLRTRAFWLSPLWAVAIVGPWLYRQWLVTGDPLWGVRYASNQIPAYTVAAMPWHFYLSSLPDAMTWPVALAGAAGLASAVWRRNALGVYAAISAFIILAWHTQYDYKEIRLVAGAFPPIAIGVGLGAGAWRERFGRLTAPALLLALATILSGIAVDRSFRTRIALGEPSFLEAMAYLQRESAPGDVLVAPNVAQVHWYSGRPTRQTPDAPDELLNMLPEASWVVITNFERGQPAYAAELAQTITRSDQFTGDVRLFGDAQFATLLARPDWVRRRLAER